ncbi:MAG: serine protease [Bacteroidales bacterium]|nr:serine protease [Bacteroidales bacterium]
METDLSKYIVPIYLNGKFNGNGFIVSHYLVTAGHVVERHPAFNSYVADIDGYPLEYNPFLMHHWGSFSGPQPKEGQYEDYVIIDIGKDFGSPLCLADTEPEIGMNLQCLSYMPAQDHLDFQETPCVVTKQTSGNIEIVPEIFNGTKERHEIVYDSCFECSFDGLLTHGNSGSPVIRDNIVYGILSCGVEIDKFYEHQDILTEEEVKRSTNYCSFYKTALIRNIIE